MSYFCRGSDHGSEWVVQLLEPDARTPVGRILTFTDSVKVVLLSERGQALRTLADRQALDSGAVPALQRTWSDQIRRRFGDSPRLHL